MPFPQRACSRKRKLSVSTREHRRSAGRKMTRDQRLVRIQASLTPKQAVLLWLKEEHQGKTSSEYLRWMMERPTSAAPRPRVQRQVVDAIRKAMKGQDPSRVEQAVREAQMQTDFLILLVNRSNWVIL